MSIDIEKLLNQDFAQRLEIPRVELADLPEGTRQILLVKSYVMISGNSIVSASNTTVSSQCSIQCHGSPSPSSEVTNGYIHFRDATDLRPPRYVRRSKTIHIHLDYRAMAQVLVQLTHANRYLWVGHFAGGHYYGDLHSE